MGWGKKKKDNDDEESLNAYTTASTSSTEETRRALSDSIFNHAAVLQESDANLMEGDEIDDMSEQTLSSPVRVGSTTTGNNEEDADADADAATVRTGVSWGNMPYPMPLEEGFPAQATRTESISSRWTVNNSNTGGSVSSLGSSTRGLGDESGRGLGGAGRSSDSAASMGSGSSSGSVTTRSSRLMASEQQQGDTDQKWGDLDQTVQRRPSASILRPAKWTSKRQQQEQYDDYPKVDTGMSATLRRFTSKLSRCSSTKIRVMLALVCVSVSLGIVLLCGHFGAAGLWINRLMERTSRTTVKGGRIPGSLGQVPAYNGTHDIPDLESMNIVIPVALENSYADWTIPFPAANRTDLPVFWTIPRAGGNVVTKIMGNCFGLVQVSGEGHNHDEPQLQILETPQGTRFVNVDSTSQLGLERAKELQLVQSGFADVMYTHLIHEAAEIFTTTNHGRLFTIFRHPMERAVSLYYQAQVLDPAVAGMSIADYASTKLPNNELTRTLVHKDKEADMSEDDLFLAMEILRRKFVMGLSSHIPESIARFHACFGWHSLLVGGVQACQDEFLTPNTARPPIPQEGTDAYTFILAQNRLDIRLFEYAQYLFDYQGGNTKEKS